MSWAPQEHIGYIQRCYLEQHLKHAHNSIQKAGQEPIVSLQRRAGRADDICPFQSRQAQLLCSAQRSGVTASISCCLISTFRSLHLCCSDNTAASVLDYISLCGSACVTPTYFSITPLLNKSYYSLAHISFYYLKYIHIKVYVLFFFFKVI